MIGSVFISRWQPYLMSLLAILVVTIVSLVQAPELRWYAAGLGGLGEGSPQSSAVAAEASRRFPASMRRQVTF